MTNNIPKILQTAAGKITAPNPGQQKQPHIREGSSMLAPASITLASCGRTMVDQVNGDFDFNARNYLNEAAINHMLGGHCQMITDLPEISRIMSFALKKEPPWISSDELAKVESDLRGAENSSDTWKILQFVQAKAINPLDKSPSQVDLAPKDIAEYESYFSKLCEDIGRNPSKGLNSLYTIQDDGRSILFLNKEANIVSTALTVRELKGVIASARDKATRDYFINLLNLPPLDENDSAKAEAINSQRKREVEIIDFFKAKPKPKPQRPLDPSRRNYEVNQGNGFGVVKSLDTTDSLSTFGLGPCVCLMIHEGNKGLMIHIDDYSGNASLTQTSAEDFLNKYIDEFGPEAKIHIQGANEDSGRKTVIEIYQYLKRQGLLSQVATANVLNRHEGHSEVVLDLRTGELHPSN